MAGPVLWHALSLTPAIFVGLICCSASKQYFKFITTWQGQVGMTRTIWSCDYMEVAKHCWIIQTCMKNKHTVVGWQWSLGHARSTVVGWQWSLGHARSTVVGWQRSLGHATSKWFCPISCWDRSSSCQPGQILHCSWHIGMWYMTFRWDFAL